MIAVYVLGFVSGIVIASAGIALIDWRIFQAERSEQIKQAFRNVG